MKTLELIEVSKEFNNGVLAVNNLSLCVQKGEIYSMLGANGAGKTTTINLIFNFLPLSKGKIIIDGIDVNSDPLRAKKKMAYISENVSLYGNLTAIQNIDYFTRLAGFRDYKIQEYMELLNKVGLDSKDFKKPVNKFSKGMRQKCGIAIALAKQTDIIILDEPTSGLDPISAKKLLNILVELRSKGKSIFLTTHDLFRAKEISDKVGVMVSGSLVKEMNIQELNQVDLEKIYINYVDKCMI